MLTQVFLTTYISFCLPIAVLLMINVFFRKNSPNRVNEIMSSLLPLLAITIYSACLYFQFSYHGLV